MFDGDTWNFIGEATPFLITSLVNTDNENDNDDGYDDGEMMIDDGATPFFALNNCPCDRWWGIHAPENYPHYHRLDAFSLIITMRAMDVLITSIMNRWWFWYLIKCNFWYNYNMTQHCKIVPLLPWMTPVISWYYVIHVLQYVSPLLHWVTP